MDASPLSTLSLELRMKIYGFVLESHHPIHVLPVGTSSDHEWRFCHCPLEAIETQGRCDCRESGMSLDTQLLQTCIQIRDEATQAIFASKTILFDAATEYCLRNFQSSFGPWLAHIKSIVLTLNDLMFSTHEYVSQIHKDFCASAVQLRHLRVHFRLVAGYDETVLDRCRLLSFLNLETATVRLMDSFAQPRGKAAITALQHQAEEILLSESSQVAQVKPTNSTAGLKRKKESEPRAVPFKPFNDGRPVKRGRNSYM